MMIFICSDNQKYSWQVAPQQSLLPLLSGASKVMLLRTIKYQSRELLKINLHINCSKIKKKKSTKKRKEEMEWAKAHILLFRFYQAFISKHY